MPFIPRHKSTETTDSVENINRDNLVTLPVSNAPDEAENDFNIDELIKTLRKENDKIREIVSYEKISMVKYLNEESKLDAFIKKEKKLIQICDTFAKNEAFYISEKIHDREELFFKIEVLQRKLCGLIRKLAHTHFTKKNDSLISDIENTKHKSLLDILQILFPYLSCEKKAEMEIKPVIKIDDTISNEDIELLLYANIIKRCSDNPGCFTLYD